MIITKSNSLVLSSLLGFYLYNIIDRSISEVGVSTGISAQFFMLLPLIFFATINISIIKKRSIFYSSFLLLFLYVAYTVSVTILYHPSTIRESLTYIVQFIIFIGALYLAKTTPTMILLEYIKKSALTVSILFLTYIAYHYLMGNTETVIGLAGESRLNINKISSTEYTIYIGSLYFLLLFSFKTTIKKAKKILLLILSLVVFFIVILSGATSPSLMIILLTSLYFIFDKKNMIKIYSAIMVFLILLFTLMSTSLYERAIDKISGIYNEDQNNIRSLIYTDIIDNIKEYPMTGIGLNTYRFSGAWYEGTDGVVTHNNILGISVAVGIPAALFYILFIFWSGIIIFKKANSEKEEKSLRIFYLSILCIIIYQQSRGLVQDTWTLKEIPFWIGLFFGIKIYEKNKNSTFNLK